MKIKFEKEKAKECLKKILPSREAIVMGLFCGGYATFCYCKGHYDGRNYFGKSWDEISMAFNKAMPTGVPYQAYIHEGDAFEHPFLFMISEDDDKDRPWKSNAEDD